MKEKLDGKPITLTAWKQEYDSLQTEYAELSPQYKPLREEVIRLRCRMRRVQYCVAGGSSHRQYRERNMR